MAGVITLLDQPRTLDALGRATSGVISFYYYGTTDLAPIYSDLSLATPAVNPINLAAGEIFPDIFLDSSITYRRRIVYGDGTIHDVPVINPDAALNNAVIVANDTQALLALEQTFIPGSYLRTADGFVYLVAPEAATNQHLTTAGGVKLYVIPQGCALKQWGALPNTGVDVWQFIQNALDNSDSVCADEGTYLITRGLRQTRNGSSFSGAGVDKTIIKALSPTGDDEFGGTDPNEAVVWALSPAEGTPINSLVCEGMTLDCSGLMTGLPSGDVRLKGHHYRRAHGFEVNAVKVIECGSYAFWANDKTIESGGTITGCSGVYNDCIALDAEIFFETTGRCYITYNRLRAEQTRSSWVWPVQETIHFYGGDGLITVNDAYVKVDSSSVIAPLLTQKNVIFNGGYFEQLNAGTTVINMNGLLSSNFDNWVFNDVQMVAAGQLGALSFGGGSGVDNKMVFNGGKYIAINGTGMTFTSITTNWGSVDIIGTEFKSTAAGASVPFSLIVTGTFKAFNVVGGSQEAYGPAVGTSPVNAAGASFTSVRFVPAGVAIPRIRQQIQISQVFANSGTFGQINFFIPINVVNINKLVVAGGFRTVSGTNATGAGEGTIGWTWNNPSPNVCNILCPTAGIGRIWSGTVTEYE